MRGSVDEVCVGNEGSGETDCGTVQGNDKDLGVIVEGTSNVNVIRDEAFDELAAHVWAGIAAGTDTCYIGTAVENMMLETC